jgi:hypothetical protein
MTTARRSKSIRRELLWAALMVSLTVTFLFLWTHGMGEAFSRWYGQSVVDHFTKP